MVTKVNRDFIEPEVAVHLARRTLAEFDINDSNSLATYFPSKEVDDIEYEIEIGQDAGFITAANWRTFGGNTTSEVWGQGEKSRGRFMPLSRNYTLDEEGALRMRNNANLMREREARNLVTRASKSIAIAVNRQRANALQHGYVKIEGSGGLRQTVNFGRDERFTTVAPQLFDNDDADILGYIESLTDLYEEVNGFRPEQVFVPSEVRRQINRHPQIVANATDSSTRPRATQSELATLFSEYDLPEIVDTPNGIIQVDDLETGQTRKVRLFDRDSILFLPKGGNATDVDSSILGRTFWGRTKSADLPEFRGTGGDLPGIVAAVIEEGWPYKQEVIADALAMPVLFNANYTLKAKVLDLSAQAATDPTATDGEKAGLNTDQAAADGEGGGA